MKIADGELRQILTHDLKLPSITVRELVADSRQSNTSLLQTALHSQAVTDIQIAKAHAKRLTLPFVDLQQNPADKKYVLRLPYQLATRYRLVCFDETASSVKIAMTEPRDERARKALRDYFGKTVRRYLATDRGLQQAMRTYAQHDARPLPLSTRELLVTILEQAMRNGSRDVHFEPLDQHLVIKRRVGKQLQVLTTLPINRYVALLSWCKLQSGTTVGNTNQVHHGSFTIRIDGLDHTVVMSTVPVIHGEKMVLRLVPPTQRIPSLTAIGYRSKDIAILEQAVRDGRGLVIIAGGKDAEVPTTLANLALQATKQPHTTVSTIEEPIHYQITKATQVEVTHALSFLDIVGAVVAQNPSTIVSTNLGKGQTAEQLVDFALSQHLVISGMYATSLLLALRQLANYPMAPALMAASLRVLVMQHQIDALCKRCRISFVPVGPLKKALKQQFKFDSDVQLYRKGAGCDTCNQGHKGSILLAELLPNTHELQQLLATGADERSIKAYITEHSDYRLQLAQLASKGLISIDEATQRAVV